jgi:hypothetical protein
MVEASCTIDPRRLRHIGSGTYSDVFEIMDGNRSTKKVLRLSYYDEHLLKSILKAISSAKDVEAAEREAKKTLDADPINVEKKMAAITNALIEKRIAPNYVRVYGTKDCLNFYHHLERGGVIPRTRTREFAAEGITYQKRYNNIKILDKYTSNLTDFIADMKGRSKSISSIQGVYRDIVFIAIFFQVFYSLLALQTYVEAFRHNDLSTNNILIEIDAEKLKRFPEYHPSRLPYTTFTVGRDVFYVPDIGIDVAIGDFDFVSGEKVLVPGLEHMKVLRNVKVKHGNMLNVKYHINPGENLSYDAQYFLAVFKKVAGEALMKTIPETSAFVARVTKDTRGKNRGRNSVTALFPRNLIRDQFFKRLRWPRLGNPKNLGKYDVSNGGKEII